MLLLLGVCCLWWAFQLVIEDHQESEPSAVRRARAEAMYAQDLEDARTEYSEAIADIERSASERPVDEQDSDADGAKREEGE
jgi:hypothetical protein